jgi:hypothetical protein
MQIVSMFVSNVLCEMSEAGPIEQMHKHESITSDGNVIKSLDSPG